MGGSSAQPTSSGGAHGGSHHLRLRRGNGYVSRDVDLSGRTGVHLRFWAKVRSFETFDTAEARVSEDGESWTTVETWTEADSNDTYELVDVDLDELGLVMTSGFSIAFDSNMDHTQDLLYIDDIELVVQGQ